MRAQSPKTTPNLLRMSSTPESPAASNILFFDNNFIRALLEGKFATELDDPNSELHRALELPFTPWRTPFSFMELIGLNPKKLPRPEAFDSSTVNDFELIIPAYRHYEAHFATLSRVSRMPPHVYILSGHLRRQLPRWHRRAKELRIKLRSQ